MKPTIDQIRRDLEPQMGVAMPDRIWTACIQEGWVDQVKAGTQSLSWLSEKVWRFWPGPRDQVKLLPREDVKRTAERQALISAILAQEANQDPQVQSFRGSVLKGKCLSFGQVERWIESQAKRDGKPSIFLSDWPLPERSKRVNGNRDGRLVFRLPSRVITVGGLSRHVLSYGVPQDRYARSVLVRYGGVLDRLRMISERLVKKFQWQPGQATLFVLTDMIPLLSEITCRASSRGRGVITLTVDAATTPQTVASAYRDVQRQVIGRRSRALSVKHLRLAAFMDPEQRGTEPWAAIRDRWNRTYPKDAYPKSRAGEARFLRDVTQARRRVLSSRITIEGVLEAISPQYGSNLKQRDAPQPVRHRQKQ